MIYRNFKVIKDVTGTWENREQTMCINNHVLYERKWVVVEIERCYKYGIVALKGSTWILHNWHALDHQWSRAAPACAG